MKNNPLKFKAAQVADIVRKAGAAWLIEGLEYAEDAEERKLARQDASDIRKVAAMVSKGDYAGAEARAQQLDTLVREVIPGAFWNFVRDYRQLVRPFPAKDQA